MNLSGSEIYKPLGDVFYRNCHGFILVYDITNKKSFEEILNSYKQIQKNNYNHCWILIGNKCDEKNKREVSYEERKKLAKEYNSYFFKTLTKSGKNINEIFYCILNGIQNS